MNGCSCTFKYASSAKNIYHSTSVFLFWRILAVIRLFLNLFFHLSIAKQIKCHANVLRNVNRGWFFHYLEDNTKHLIFWLCNMKQLNFRHFNTTSKKFTVTVNFFQKETKTAQKRPILFCLVYQGVFDHFATIPDYFRRFPKTTKDVRRLPKMSKDNRRFPRRDPKIFQKQIRFDNAERLWCFFFTKNPPNI